MENQALTPEQKEFLIEQALQTEEGRIALASSMANPIRLTLDYQGIGRKLLVVECQPRNQAICWKDSVSINTVGYGENFMVESISRKDGVWFPLN